METGCFGGAAAAGVGDCFKPLFDRQRGLVSLPFSIDIHILALQAEISDHRMLSYSSPTAYSSTWQYCHLYQPPISSFVSKSLVLELMSWKNPVSCGLICKPLKDALKQSLE
jgi:hypothetical protein